MSERRNRTPGKTSARTSTSNFGAGRRESHDASPFYERFAAPELSDDDHVAAPLPVAPFHFGDSRDMSALADASVALVVTSPPYFAGKKYEEELERDGVPSSYGEYLELLHDVFRECRRVLEPGGRIAVNVANLGRKPYRSLSADVIRILQDDLHMMLRGEIVWQKGEGAAGSCAWGSYRSATNPVLRDLTERVVVASKGRFDRALSPKQRERRGLPHESTISADEFMAATLDVWELAPESARRVRHPAPFPVELPERLINLYTFRNDLVIDPFMGSGSTLVAAARTGRRFAGYDLDPDYVEIARGRVAEELARLAREPEPKRTPAVRPMLDHARETLELAGFRAVVTDRRVKGTGTGVRVAAEDAAGGVWSFDVSGGFTASRNGLARTDVLWRTLGRAQVLSRAGVAPLVLLTSHLPGRRSEGDQALRACGPGVVFDVVALDDDDAFTRLCTYAKGGQGDAPLPGFWSAAEIHGP
jgi:site-specific DNA-methyltransferase (adenine-specific)